MRFRSKFGAIGWVFLVNSLIIFSPLLSGRHMDLTDKILGTLMAALVLIQILERYFVYWVVDQDSVHERRYWRRRDIPSSDILRVAGRNYWRMRPLQLRIDYFRGTEPPKNGKLYASPADVDGFVKALRGMAPAAAIDV